MNHDNIVRLIAFSEGNERPPVLVMECVESSCPASSGKGEPAFPLWSALGLSRTFARYCAGVCVPGNSTVDQVELEGQGAPYQIVMHWFQVAVMACELRGRPSRVSLLPR